MKATIREEKSLMVNLKAKASLTQKSELSLTQEGKFGIFPMTLTTD